MFNYAPINLIITLLIFISVISIIIYIQVKLSRSENKFLGLILPILSFLLSLFIIIGMTMFTTMTTSIDGVVQSTEQIETNINYLNIFFLFLVTNIPTFILAGIYVSERNKINIKMSIDKMKIEDL